MTERSEEQPAVRFELACLFIDIDHFKQLNDGFGHPAGDQVLEFCARAAKDAFHKATVGRLGGDEFAVLCRPADEPIALLAAVAALASVGLALFYAVIT